MSELICAGNCPLFSSLAREQMQEAKDKRLELIRELRSTHALQESGLAVKSNEAGTIGVCVASCVAHRPSAEAE